MSFNPVNPPAAGEMPLLPVLIYNGESAYWRRIIERWRAITGDRIEYITSDQAGSRFSSIPAIALRENIWLVDPDGRLKEGAAAILRAFSLAGRRRPLWWAYKHFENFRNIADRTYAWVSDHPERADQLDRLLLPDPNDLKRSYVLSRSIFIRALGVVFLIAFISIWVQIHGLIGSDGILPIQLLLNQFRLGRPELNAFGRFVHFPTLLWINSSDTSLNVICGLGTLFSCLLIAGFCPALVLSLLYLLYLSIVNAGQDFLGFQWDALLLESALVAILFSPLQLWLRPGFVLGRRSNKSVAAPSRIALFLLRWLLFRVMFLSGLVKLIAHVPAWRDFTAMRYHYETQPLPTWTSWYAHLLPDWFQALSVGGVFFIEGLVPLLFFAPRRLRLFACAMTVLFQVLIAATGNFGFFNLLAIVLCISLLDDAVFARWRIRRKPTPVIRRRRWNLWLVGAATAALVILSIVPSMMRLRLLQYCPSPLKQAYFACAQFDVVNPYGLFEDMTTRRPELIVFGSDDGVEWKEYRFKWKPGPVGRPPGFCSPHMPRLDWQMWFAALGVYYQDRQPKIWLGYFMLRLHEGSPAVLQLMDDNPFPRHPPKYVRLELYDYRFTTAPEHSRTGNWWDRRLLDSNVLQLSPANP